MSMYITNVAQRFTSQIFFLEPTLIPAVGFEDDKEFELVNMVKTLPIKHKKLQEIRQETEADKALLKSLILKGRAI